MSPKQTETQLMREIRVALLRQGIVHVVRNNVGVFRTSNGAAIRVGLGTGSPDLVGVVKSTGRAVGFEVKTATGRVSREQESWHRVAAKFGMYVCVVRTVKEALEHAEKAAEN